MILIPARNEGPRIGAVIAGCQAALPHTDVLVVVNGCTDDTEDQARRAGAIVVPSSPGYATALHTGYRAALEHALLHQLPGWLVQLDADGQHPPSALPALRDALAGADLVIGSRFATGTPSWLSPRRRRLMAAMARAASLLADTPLTDSTSGMQALGPDVLRAFAQHFPDQIADANVLIRARRLGFRVAEVPVSMAPRSGGESMHGGIKSLRYGLRLAAAMAHERLRTPG